MTANRRTDFDPNDDGPPLEFLTETDAPARPERPTPTKINCIPLPNYAVDRRHDVRARDYANATTLPYKDGWFARFEPMAEPGWYFGEMRAGNQIVGGDVFEIKPGGRLGETTSAPPAFAASLPSTAAPAQPEPTSAQSINATTETIRATKELLKEVQPPPTQPTESVEAIVERALAKQREEFTRTIADTARATAVVAETPKTLAEQLRELKDAKEVLGDLYGPQRNDDGGEALDRALGWMDKIDNLRERAGGAGGYSTGGSWFDKLMHVADRHGEKIITGAASVLPQLIAAVKPARVEEMAQAAGMTQPPAQPLQQGQPTQQAAPPQGPQDSQEALSLVVYVAASDLALNRRIGRTCDVIEEQVRRFPELAPLIQQLLQTEPVAVLSHLEQMSGRNDLAAMGHAIEWIEDLADELRGEDEGEQPDAAQPVVNATNNGHGASVAGAKA